MAPNITAQHCAARIHGFCLSTSLMRCGISLAQLNVTAKYHVGSSIVDLICNPLLLAWWSILNWYPKVAGLADSLNWFPKEKLCLCIIHDSRWPLLALCAWPFAYTHASVLWSWALVEIDIACFKLYFSSHCLNTFIRYLESLVSRVCTLWTCKKWCITMQSVFGALPCTVFLVQFWSVILAEEIFCIYAKSA